jgi:hypothetical protein
MQERGENVPPEDSFEVARESEGNVLLHLFRHRQGEFTFYSSLSRTNLATNGCSFLFFIYYLFLLLCAGNYIAGLKLFMLLFNCVNLNIQSRN